MCRISILFASCALIPITLCAQETVCDMFKDLKASNGRRVILTGELLVAKDLLVLGTPACDNSYSTKFDGSINEFQGWPTAVHLRPSPRVSIVQRQELEQLVIKAEQLKHASKPWRAAGTFAGRLLVEPTGDWPAELTFDSTEDISIEELPDARKLPVVPICELFQNLAAWKGQRIAVRGESQSSPFSGRRGIGGRCEGTFETNGYHWPVELNYGKHASYAPSVSELVGAKFFPERTADEDPLRRRKNVIRSVTYVGRLRMRDHYRFSCRYGHTISNGFGYLNRAAAELIVEAVMDAELTTGKQDEGNDDKEQRCEPPDHDALCAGAGSLLQAVGQNCLEQTKKLLAKEMPDNNSGEESPALRAAIRVGNEAIVQLLLDAEAPLNPSQPVLEPPLMQAASARKMGLVKMLLARGARVDGKNSRGETYLASHRGSDTRLVKIFLEAGADINARDSEGRTPLINASFAAYEEAVKFFIEQKADVNLADNKGRTALMAAASGWYVDAVPHLLNAGADLHARDLDGKTALDLARIAKNPVAEQMLVAAGAGR